MDRASILDKVCQLVGDTLEVDAAGVGEETSFDDLGADSFDKLELITALEDEFGLTLADDALEKITTVRDVVDAIESAR